MRKAERDTRSVQVGGSLLEHHVIQEIPASEADSKGATDRTNGNGTRKAYRAMQMELQVTVSVGSDIPLRRCDAVRRI